LNRAAHPWRFTRMTMHSSGSEQPGTRRDAAISQLIRVPPRRGSLISSSSVGLQPWDIRYGQSCSSSLFK
jgi:hypothetical protein